MKKNTVLEIKDYLNGIVQFVQCYANDVEHNQFYDPVTPVKGIGVLSRIEWPPLHFNILYLKNKNQWIGLH